MALQNPNTTNATFAEAEAIKGLKKIENKRKQVWKLRSCKKRDREYS